MEFTKFIALFPSRTSVTFLVIFSRTNQLFSSYCLLIDFYIYVIIMTLFFIYIFFLFLFFSLFILFFLLGGGGRGVKGGEFGWGVYSMYTRQCFNV